MLANAKSKLRMHTLFMLLLLKNYKRAILTFSVKSIVNSGHLNCPQLVAFSALSAQRQTVVKISKDNNAISTEISNDLNKTN